MAISCLGGERDSDIQAGKNPHLAGLGGQEQSLEKRLRFSLQGRFNLLQFLLNPYFHFLGQGAVGIGTVVTGDGVEGGTHGGEGAEVGHRGIAPIAGGKITDDDFGRGLGFGLGRIVVG